MKFQIIEYKLLSGRAAKIYTIKENGDDLTYLDHFIEDNIEKYSQEVGTILSKLKGMGNCTGCEWNLFEHNEGHGGGGRNQEQDDAGRFGGVEQDAKEAFEVDALIDDGKNQTDRKSVV